MKKKLINWTDEYSVDFELIDSQHKKLAGMINDLFASFTEGKANEVVDKILNEMIDYTDYHFKAEEKYFEKYNYSQTQTHIDEHQKFVKQVTDFYSDFKKGSVTISYDIMNFLRDWFLKHILGSDKKYANEFQDKGIKEL